MGQYSSYYLYQKYEKRGSQDWIPCIPNVFSITGDSTNPMSASAKSECDPQCGCSTVQYRWVNIDPSIDWICDGTSKYYKQRREMSYDGVTWIPLDEYRKGDLVPGASSDCTEPTPTLYRWVQTDDTICVSTFDGKFKAIYLGGSEYELPCDGNATLTNSNVRGGYSYTSMTTAEIGSCVTNIDAAFYQCYYLTSVTIPTSVISIGNRAFCLCTRLPSVTIPNSVTSIGNQAFYYCTSLSDVVIPNSVLSIGNNAFTNCTGLTSLDIPNSVQTIEGGAFDICSGLTSVSIGSGLTTLGCAAFANCTSLTGVTINATTPPTILNQGTVEGEMFNNTNNCPIFVPFASVNAFKTAQYWSDYSSRIQAIS